MTKAQRICTIEGCNRCRKFSSGLCETHGDRLKKGADLHAPVRSKAAGRACAVEGCEGSYYARDFCGLHYTRFKRGRPLEGPEFRRRVTELCEVDGCGRRYISRKMCGAHYMRWREGRDLDTPVRPYNPPTDGRCVLPNCDEPRGQKWNSEGLLSHCLMHERRRFVLRGHGLTFDEYDRLFAAQHGCCAICGKEDPGFQKGTLHIDHDHLTNEVRGLLCGTCNQGIGLLKDDPETMRAAAQYVESYRLNSQGNRNESDPSRQRGH